jgi:hypothetical protein
VSSVLYTAMRYKFRHNIAALGYSYIRGRGQSKGLFSIYSFLTNFGYLQDLRCEIETRDWRLETNNDGDW